MEHTKAYQEFKKNEETIIQYPACSVHGALLCADYGICRERDGRTACLQL